MFLTRSAAEFDKGAEEEAVRLAGACRVLFSESGGSSLVRQLGVHKTIQLPDTAQFDRQVIGPGLSIQMVGEDERGNDLTLPIEARGGLVDLGQGTGSMRWFAPGDTRMEGAAWLPLPRWLSAAAVRGSSGATHSRWDFIRVLTNQEGGAHVDSTIDADYAQLRADTLGVLSGPIDVLVEPDGSIRFPDEIDMSGMLAPEANVVEASMRQIAHEAIRGLERQFSMLTPYRP
jgi:hypothetical protein